MASTIIIHVQTDASNPEEIADMVVRDMIDDGIDATVDDIVDHDIVSKPEEPASSYSEFIFRCNALEGGHGQDFRAIFMCRRLHPNGPNAVHYCVESVDVACEAGINGWVGVGGVGGEVCMDCPLNSDGSENMEQMCRDWVGKWFRRFHGETEDSVAGMYRIIKQIVADGRPDNH